MSVVHRLSGAAMGTHIADQVALISVPLVATLAFGASPEIIGVLVACQSMAHLMGPIPFGLLVDQRQLRNLAIASALTSLTGFAGATLSILLGSPYLFGIAVTLAGFGVVLFGLTALSILPRAVGSGDLTKANSQIEMPRAFCAFLVPLVVGLLAGIVPEWTLFLGACAGSVIALAMSCTLPKFEVVPQNQASFISRISKGAEYVIGHPFLLPIALCAIFWNLAFAALLVVLVPVINNIYQFDPGAFGVSMSSFGLAALCGTWLAGRYAQKITPAALLLFGPGISFAATAGLLTIGPDTSVIRLYGIFFLLGFGPSIWLITQNSVRQLVTPPEMLGRVNAVIQTAIYDIRPLGALTGDVIACAAGLQSGLVLVVVSFALSFLAALFSGLRTVKSWEALKSTGYTRV